MNRAEEIQRQFEGPNTTTYMVGFDGYTEGWARETDIRTFRSEFAEAMGLLSTDLPAFREHPMGKAITRIHQASPLLIVHGLSDLRKVPNVYMGSFGEYTPADKSHITVEMHSDIESDGVHAVTSFSGRNDSTIFSSGDASIKVCLENIEVAQQTLEDDTVCNGCRDNLAKYKKQMRKVKRSPNGLNGLGRSQRFEIFSTMNQILLVHPKKEEGGPTCQGTAKTVEFFKEVQRALMGKTQISGTAEIGERALSYRFAKPNPEEEYTALLTSYTVLHALDIRRPFQQHLPNQDKGTICRIEEIALHKLQALFSWLQG